MKLPQIVEFDGLTLTQNDIKSFISDLPVAIIPTEWKRVIIDVPDTYSAPSKVNEWLAENCINGYASYEFSDPVTYDGVMVIRFEDVNDALMFKLRDGHKAWEQSDDS